MNQFAKVVPVLVLASALTLAGCSASPANDQSDAPLADTVWSQVEANFPDGISSSSPLFIVTSVEDVSTGTIRVNVQETVTEEERTVIARHVFNMGALKNADLKTVVVRDLSGKDSNHYR